MCGRPWTEDERAELLALHRKGYPARRIARHLGRQATAVRERLIAAGETPILMRPHSPPWTPREDQRLRALVIAGASWAEVAAAHDRSPRGCWDRWRVVRQVGDPRGPVLPRSLACQPRTAVPRNRPMLDPEDAAVASRYRAEREMGDQWDRIHARRAGARTQVWLERGVSL